MRPLKISLLFFLVSATALAVALLTIHWRESVQQERETLLIKETVKDVVKRSLNK